jgi:hypothetical protein
MNKVGRPKGGKSKRWTPEEKERIVKRYFEGEISRTQLAKEEKVTDSMLHVNVNLKMLKSSNMKMHNYLIVICFLVGSFHIHLLFYKMAQLF